MRKKLKNYLYIGLISLGLFLFLELLTRLFWNQEIRMDTEKPGEHPFVLDSQTYTFRNNPGVKYRYSKPEWSITCAINKEGMRDANTYLDKPRDTSKIRILAIGD